jgi:hypothetical protein
LENLQDQTSTLHRAVNVLDNRTIHISQSIDNLATATALSQNQIRDLARTEGTLNQVQLDTNSALGSLVSQLRKELNPLFRAIGTSQPATNRPVAMPSASSEASNGITEVMPPQHTPEEIPANPGQSLAKHSFHLRTRIGDCPRYNGDRANNAAHFWTAKAYLWLKKYQTLTRTKISEDQAIALLTDSLEERVSKWWIQLERTALITQS